MLKYARAERVSLYHYLNVFYKARKLGQTEEYKENEEESGKEYEKITRKMFVLENILRQRLGYVPHRITDDYLARYLEEMKKGKHKPMIIRQKRRDEVKSGS
ncbi:hypothetical protein E2K98_24215 [Bacillus salipaludis]|uniref:Uncharacterized protein n=1 Tax=Bacillus salipaludis TaxID=2547811 RepID=A0A4R5VJX0_9BACI|nr:hypothetical protein [Bacillus salipaludis]MDQ6598911.1 hypothetical protein [Bacillus salipaludis]TDK58188.1 hypothetical protein E2K98_24215 [Bacillus salipaludis]